MFWNANLSSKLKEQVKKQQQKIHQKETKEKKKVMQSHFLVLWEEKSLL